MFPQLRQRLLILAAVVAGGLVYLRGEATARAADGSDGLTLLFAAEPTAAVGAFILLSVPVVVLAAAAAAAGNPLAGIFTVAAALIFPVVRSGTIDHWMGNAAAPSDLLGLSAESGLWAVGVAGAVLSCGWLSARMRPWWAGGGGGGGTTVPPAGRAAAMGRRAKPGV